MQYAKDGEHALGHDNYSEADGVFLYDNTQTAHGKEPKYLYHYTDRQSLAAITRKGGNYQLKGSRNNPYNNVNNTSHGDGTRALLAWFATATGCAAQGRRLLADLQVYT